MRLAVRSPSASLLALLVALAAVTVSCDSTERIAVRIDGLAIDAEVARTVGERTQGLSGRPSLPEDGGMLFVFQEEGRPGFWMRGMRFSLDFIWISGAGRVVDLTEGVPPPEPGFAEDDLPRYRPDALVLFVLEVNAGIARSAGVQVGDRVTFEPNIAQEQMTR